MESSTQFKQFCDELKQIREEKKISLEKMSATLRIREDYLQHIEEGNVHQLPAGYERIFFKSYLTFLGVDVDLKLAEADRLHFKKNKEPENKSALKAPEIDLTKIKLLVSWVPILIVVFGLVYFVIQNFSGEEKEPVVQEMPIEEAKTTIDTVVEEISVEDTLETVDSLKLDIQVVDDVFFFLTIDSVYTVQKMGRKGNTYTYFAEHNFNVYVKYGNNAQLVLNDSLVQDRTLPDHEITYIYLDHDGVKGKRIQKIEVKEDEKTTDTSTVLPDTTSF